jgi:esterase/lipase superfamily enzyme
MVVFRTAPAFLRVAVIGVALALAGCGGGKRAHDLFAETAATTNSGIVATEQIYIATTRAPSDDPRVVYAGVRADEPTFATVDISIPAVHKPGAIERPKGKVADPSKYFTARTLTKIDGIQDFTHKVAADARSDGGRALVFVHGYNTHFDDAVYRVTQIAHDSSYDGAPILFTWASGGRAIDYVYDRDSANAARDALEQLLRTLAKSGIGRIDIVAHSMGTWLTMEALRGLAIAGDRDIGGKLGDVVLASPDIDYNVFRTQMQRYGKPDRPFYVLLSGDDRVLRFSSLIAGQQPRLGEYANAKDIAALGIIVVDLSAIKAGDSYNHTKFADNPVLVKLLGEGLRNGQNLSGDRDLSDGLALFARGIGNTLGTAAAIVVTTPTTVIDVVVNQ